MKALSIKEPWASMILNGVKTIETRTWATKYRGKILLCASKNPPGGDSGNAFAIAEIIDCRDMTLSDENEACCEVYPNAKSWVLSNVRRIDPFPVKGQLGLFEVEIGKISKEEYENLSVGDHIELQDTMASLEKYGCLSEKGKEFKKKYFEELEGEGYLSSDNIKDLGDMKK